MREGEKRPEVRDTLRSALNRLPDLPIAGRPINFPR
jgi:hypothetical protein